MAELYRLMMVADVGELRTLVEGTPAQPFLEEHNSSMFDSIRSVTSAAIGPLEYVAQQRAGLLDPRLGRATTAAACCSCPTVPDRSLRCARRSPPGCASRSSKPWIARARRPAGSGSGDSRQLWFVVDELDALGQIDGLKDALARLRKFGGRCVLGFQSIAQVSSTYGQGDAHTIVENCGNTLSFAAPRARAAEPPASPRNSSGSARSCARGFRGAAGKTNSSVRSPTAST